MRIAKALVVVLLASTLSACGKKPEPGTFDFFVAQLEEKHTRIEAIKKLGELGDKRAVALILPWLGKDGDWQPDAAYALGQLGDKAVAAQLVAAIKVTGAAAQDPTARRQNRLAINAARALVLLGAPDAGKEIRRLLDSGDVRVREAGIIALGELGDRAFVPELLKLALADKEPSLRQAAVRALGDLGDAKAVPALVQMLFIELPNVSFYDQARYSLIQIGRGAVSDLVRTLARENAEVEAIRIDGKPLTAGVIEAKAASVLGALRAPEATEPIAAVLAKTYADMKKQGPSPAATAVVVELAYALGTLDGGKAAAALMPLVKDTDAGVRLAACESLTSLGDRAAVKDLLVAARSGDAAARKAAIDAVSRLGTAADRAAYDALAKSADAATPADLLADLLEAGQARLVAAAECNDALECWKKKLADTNAVVRERAVYELGWRAAKETKAELLKAAEDVDLQVRMAAVLSLGRVAGLDAKTLEAIYEKAQAVPEYAGVNQELLRLIARAKSSAKK